tara:strand:+ start:287 stop:547 length:261 start_codon:yes stop_codon:yes gene_type:complete
MTHIDENFLDDQYAHHFSDKFTSQEIYDIVWGDMKNDPAVSVSNDISQPVLSPELRLELRQLINDVLDEREMQKRLNGPYDFPEDE